MHARRRIVDEVGIVLKNLATTGGTVYDEPAAAIESDTFPAVVIEIKGETVEVLGDVLVTAPHVQLRRLNITTTVFAKSITDRDQACLEIEEAIMDSDIARDRKLLESDFEANGDGASRIWSALISFELTYLTNSSYPRAEYR